ncbi:hypothetical protein CAEBREN_19077 [Caenorhabditis brenneri]|uniref:Uncharacterized protein n=1 Tax=Caenorhabditis brenneri TaxID=135651 RepID=G0NCM5_CAEBE|nr:hypothetical protein CAEBREN_19077 [Caenorhabditis brenneri]
MATELNQLSTQSQSSESEGVEEEKIEKTEKLEEEKLEEPPARPMNRKEKRRLQRLKELETGEIVVKKKVTEVLEVAKIPKRLEKIFCDTATFSSYSAKFGYSATRTNNFVHFSLQNPTGTHAIVGSQDRYIRVYGLENEVAVQWKHNTGNLILDSCWESSGKGVFSTSKLRPIQLFETETGTILGAYNGKDAGVSG